jgi:hypothetical protein
VCCRVDVLRSLSVLAAPALSDLDAYLSFVGNVYYRSSEVGVAGDSPADFLIHRRAMLGQLKNPLRQRTVIDRWTPYEVALFESGVCLIGKDFQSIAEMIPGKTHQDVMEFFYQWKKSKNYARWKALYRHPARE